jgi:hypothetical protein
MMARRGTLNGQLGLADDKKKLTGRSTGEPDDCQLYTTALLCKTITDKRTALSASLPWNWTLYADTHIRYAHSSFLWL